MERLVTPVTSSRAWGSALSPNAAGSFNFITSFWEHGSPEPTEHVIVDVKTGAVRRIEDRPGRNISSFGYGGQTRTANGRIFFPIGNTPTLAYYDPAEETIKSLGALLGTELGDRMFYQRVVGPDDMVYLATHSYQNPTVVRVDPETLEWRVIGKVGQKERPTYCYPYTMAVDPPWVYVAIGRVPWELAAINQETGESKALMRREEPDSWLRIAGGGLCVHGYFTTNRGKPNEQHEFFWVADGEMYPNTAANRWNFTADELPFKARDARQKSYPVENAPELNLDLLRPDANGNARIRWRLNKEDDWSETTFQVENVSPITIQSLDVMPDGTLLGHAAQYHGFFRFDPNNNESQAFGRFSVSRGPRLVHDGRVYISGYPNGSLWVYDPDQTWGQGNPRYLVNTVNLTNSQYPSHMASSANGRLYIAARLERQGTGAGIAYYDINTGKFDGHRKRLANLAPRSLLVADDMQRVIFTGAEIRGVEGEDAPPDAGSQLIVFDMDLNEIERITVRPGIAAAGNRLTRLVGPDGKPSSVIIGVIPPEKAIYRFDLAEKRLLGWYEFDGGVSSLFRRESDGTLWMVMQQEAEPKGNVLVCLDPTTMRWENWGKLSRTGSMVWLGNELYVASEGGIWKIALPEEPETTVLTQAQ